MRKKCSSGFLEVSSCFLLIWIVRLLPLNVFYAWKIVNKFPTRCFVFYLLPVAVFYEFSVFFFVFADAHTQTHTRRITHRLIEQTESVRLEGDGDERISPLTEIAFVDTHESISDNCNSLMTDGVNKENALHELLRVTHGWNTAVHAIACGFFNFRSIAINTIHDAYLEKSRIKIFDPFFSISTPKHTRNV